MANATNGADILLYANTGTDASPSYTALGSQKGVNITESLAIEDASHKQTANQATEYIPFRYSSTASVNGFFVRSEVALVAMKSAIRNRQTIKIRASVLGTQVEEADVWISNFSHDSDDQSISTYSFDMTVNGSWTAV